MEKEFYKTRDYLTIFTAFNDTVRIYLAKTTGILKDATKNKEFYPTSAAALGRTLTATLIMGQMLKGDQSVAVKIEGDGPIGKIVCESDTSGRVMGYVSNEQVYLKYNNGKLAVGLAVGNEGSLQVVKDLHLKEPFVSSVPLISGEIAEDFTYYFAISEQVPSSVSLGVLVGLNNEILSSGGFVIQIMPGCEDGVINLIEDNIKKIKPISELILANTKPRDIVKMIVGETDYECLKVMPVMFKCRCSKDNFKKGIKSLGKDTVLKLLNEDKGATTTCNYCGQSYNFSEDDLKDILKEIKA